MKKYALVGASSRALYMFAKPLVKDFKDVAKITGIFDINSVRAKYVQENTDPAIPVYTDFDQMMRETKPDATIITTVDRFHHEYIIKSLEYGCDAITEKPMTIDDEKCNAILDAERRTGKKVIVTFNYRFAPYVTRVKELLKEGAVGKILSVDFEYLLDTRHGADYFRRWHRRMENCGGLLVHKSTHHFDLVNWWIEEEPEEIYANGNLRFYGPSRENRGERCSRCQYAKTCEFAVRYHEDSFMKEFYFNAEKEDGYYRDRCVFDDEINIYDSMSVTVKYNKGTILTYSLIAYSPYEGWKISINGTGGRLEAAEYHSGLKAKEPTYQITLYNRKGDVITYDVPKATGGHGGGDERLREMIFRGNIPDPLNHCADSYDGVKSIMIGICANKSIKEKRMFRPRDLVRI
ncbi:MAG: Gfo/Idh/MocA family oxidoreductase [Clostridiaceae bacterium]|nr:Gfo/Idh/MocA family oxidoreductase [Clostridiaceae bacterium]